MVQDQYASVTSRTTRDDAPGVVGRERQPKPCAGASHHSGEDLRRLRVSDGGSPTSSKTLEKNHSSDLVTPSDYMTPVCTKNEEGRMLRFGKRSLDDKVCAAGGLQDPPISFVAVLYSDERQSRWRLHASFLSKRRFPDGVSCYKQRDKRFSIASSKSARLGCTEDELDAQEDEAGHVVPVRTIGLHGVDDVLQEGMPKDLDFPNCSLVSAVGDRFLPK